MTFAPVSGIRLRGRSWAAALFLLSPAWAGTPFLFHVMGNDPGSWPVILSSIGLIAGPAENARLVIAPNGTSAPVPEWTARVERGTILVLEGESPLAAAFGFRPSGKTVEVRGITDVHAPKLRIVWEKPLQLPAFEVPAEARAFAKEKRQGAPLVAGFKRGAGAVLWVAAPPGPLGYERFPYLLQALADLGLEPPFRSTRLWAFFDSAYRARVDLDYIAARWRAAGITALHVAAWHYWESEPQSDEYLRTLIDVCHRHAISVYAWIELPHVSEKFWNDHPEWREKTALLEDAQLDWRKLINLTNRSAFAAVSSGLRDLAGRFDWDGINLAELYFESLEGYENPARLTPMNDDVRSQFHQASGFDPRELFDPQSANYNSKNPKGLQDFLEFRARLAESQQKEWIAEIEALRKTKPQLDVVLTHVDDRFDPTIRQKIGASTRSRLLPLAASHDLTFLVEDPATIWNLGPQRYAQIASRYGVYDRLAIDINIVERYQDVYPTKQQTGTELFELVHAAAAAFPRVALYFENSVLPPDLPFLASAASTIDRAEQTGSKLVVETRRGVGIPWKGSALVDGRVWPVANDTTIWLPPGTHVIQSGEKQAPLRLLEFNGDLKSANAANGGVEFAYQSSARAMALLDRLPSRIEIDGAGARPETCGACVSCCPGGNIW